MYIRTRSLIHMNIYHYMRTYICTNTICWTYVRHKKNVMCEHALRHTKAKNAAERHRAPQRATERHRALQNATEP